MCAGEVIRSGNWWGFMNWSAWGFMELTERIENLVLEQLAGELTAGEARELNDWINQAEENREAYTAYCSLWYNGMAGQYCKMGTKEAVWRDIVRKRQKRAHLKLIHGLVAAAACITLFIGGYRIFLSPEKSVSMELMVADLLVAQKPEQVKLVLSSGEEVFLAERVLAQEKGVSIYSDSSGLKYTRQQKMSCPDGQVVYNELIVPKCGEYRIILADGTKIYMNSESALRFPVSFAGDKREVWLSGEAYFEVMRNEKQPFIVHMDQVDVKVLGTSFNIMAYQNERDMEVTLVQGKVEVSTSLQHEILLPGNQMQVNNSTVRMTSRKVDVNQYVAWKEGILRFDDMPLGQLVNRLSRWYDITFEFRREDLKQRLFSGGFRKYEQLERILNMIQEINDVTFEVVDNKVIIDKK